jgi:hypothetical protein
VLVLVVGGSLCCRSSVGAVSPVPARRWRYGSYDPGMTDPEVLERIAARRAELDGLEEQLVKQLEEVRAERDELAVAERVLQRMSEQITEERAVAVPVSAQVGGRAVWMIPDREPGVEETALPPEYQRILAVVRKAGGPVMVRQVGEELGLDTGVRGKLEPLRGKLRKRADRGWLHKRPDGCERSRNSALSLIL